VTSWRRTGAVDPDVTVYVHVFDHEGRLAGILDGDPWRGMTRLADLPLDSWVVDVRPLAPSTPGQYEVTVGLYHRISGDRPEARVECRPVNRHGELVVGTYRIPAPGQEVAMRLRGGNGGPIADAVP
jgi:hypothetical protein